MNETLRTIKSRYSCRKYTGEPVEQEKLEAIALAGLQAPSAMNNQPWKIIVIKDKAFIDEMDAATMDMLSKSEEQKGAYERMMSRGGKIFYNAPCMFVVAQKAGTDLDCGIVTENIALAASSLGLGNVICGLARLVFDTEKGEDFKKIIPEGYELGMTVLVGYAVDEGGTPHEVDMDKVKYI